MMKNQTIRIQTDVDRDLYEKFCKIARFADVSISRVINKGMGEYIGRYLNPEMEYSFTPKAAYLLSSPIDKDSDKTGYKCVWICEKKIGSMSYSKVVLNGHDIWVPSNEVVIYGDYKDVDGIVKFLGEQ